MICDGFDDIRAYFNDTLLPCRPELKGFIWGRVSELAHPESRGNVKYPCLALEYPDVDAENVDSQEVANWPIGLVILHNLPRDKYENRQAAWRETRRIAKLFALKLRHDAETGTAPFFEASKRYSIKAIDPYDAEQDIGWRLEITLSGHENQCHNEDDWLPPTP